MGLKTKKDKIFLITLVGLSLIFLSYGYLFLSKIHDINILCPIYQWTGYYCLGCGITRSIFALLQLDIVNAFYYHPLFVCMLPFLIFYLGMISYCWVNEKEWKLPTWCLWILGIIVVVFTVGRNIIL